MKRKNLWKLFVVSILTFVLFSTNIFGWTHSWYQPTASYRPVHKEDTIIWCKDLGMSSSVAKTVGFHCENVDILFKTDYKWHLDRSHFTGATQDTRILQSKNEMILAKRKLDSLALIEAKIKITTSYWERSKLVLKAKILKEEALCYLGRSLHPIQDEYAHMDAGIDTPDAELGISHGMLNAPEVDVLIQYQNGTSEHRMMKIETSDSINLYSFYDDICYDYVEGQWVYYEGGTKEQNTRWIKTKDTSVTVITEFMDYAEGLGLEAYFQ